MSMRRTVILGSFGWLAVISLLHGCDEPGPVRPPAGPVRDERPLPRRLPAGHLPPDLSRHPLHQRAMTGDGIFEPVRFNGWPELKEAYLADDLEATFILAPLAMSLREQGVPIKIVYLGHRDGTTMMVHKDSTILRIEDLRGKTIAVPNRFSNQRLIIFKALKERGMSIKRRDARRDAAARHARGAVLPLGRCGHLGRAVHGPDRDGRLRPRPVHDQGRLARVHLVRAGRQRADHRDPPRRGPAPGGRHRPERQVARPARWTTGCRRPTSPAHSITTRTRSCSGSCSASRPTGSSTPT